MENVIFTFGLLLELPWTLLVWFEYPAEFIFRLALLEADSMFPIPWYTNDYPFTKGDSPESALTATTHCPAAKSLTVLDTCDKNNLKEQGYSCCVTTS